MVNQRSSNPVVPAVIGILLVVGIAYWWMPRGYGKVSPKTYEFSTAIYSACLKKSDEHLDKIVELLDSTDESQLPQHERKWLEAIIADAQNQNWEPAAKKAKRMMNDQVEF